MVESTVVTTPEPFFGSLYNKFLLLCDDSEAKGEKTKVLEKVLRTNVKEKAAEVGNP